MDSAPPDQRQRLAQLTARAIEQRRCALGEVAAARQQDRELDAAARAAERIASLLARTPVSRMTMSSLRRISFSLVACTSTISPP